MIPAAHQNHVAVPSLQRAFGGVGCGVEMLERKSLWLADAVVVNLVEIDFHWRIMHVVFVGRIARPVSSGSVDLDDHQLVGGKSRRHDVHDLARRVSPPPKPPTDSEGLINLGSSCAVEGTLHSAISQAVSAVKVTAFPAGR